MPCTWYYLCFKKKKKKFKVCDNSFCDISTLSFHPAKIITSGEGGALLTNNYRIYKKALSLMNHGYQKSYIKKKKDIGTSIIKFYFPDIISD